MHVALSAWGGNERQLHVEARNLGKCGWNACFLRAASEGVMTCSCVPVSVHARYFSVDEFPFPCVGFRVVLWMPDGLNDRRGSDD